ncbi:unnamed protein product [Adineta steineri]|uniref:Glycosyltransferase family 92 protein n=3 Tax=Adineta steineri TaxID=433720 RepID=A0A815NC10_9BILA|nr:unnamed protein product [Adineta steineri]
MRFVLFILILFTLLSGYIHTKCPLLTTTLNAHISYPSYYSQFRDVSHTTDGWKPVGHTLDEQNLLHNMSIVVAAWPENTKDNIPTVPCLSADGHLLVLSVAASRIRYGVSLTFVTVYPTDMKTVLPKHISSHPLSSDQQSLWCIFSDGSVTPVYIYDSNFAREHVSLLDCPLSQFANDQLWKLNQTIRVYLASTTTEDRKIPILKAFVKVPVVSIISSNSSQESFTLCTSPLRNKANYLVQWIEFHRLVGFSKFVIYNTTDTGNYLSTVINMYNQKYPGLVDVVQWSFSTLGLADAVSIRYFQIEALHDCLIRYGDQSEWLSAIDLDEYIVPLPPYETIVDYIHENFGRRIIGSINLKSQFFCSKNSSAYTPEEKDTNRLTIERFTFRARHLYEGGREKYLYRPRFVQYLSIHRQVIGLSKEQPSEKHITIAHYVSMTRLRAMRGCGLNETVEDISVRNRFVNKYPMTKTIVEKTFGQNKNVIVTPDSFSAADGLATLTLCQHTILTAGTFGWWGGFLSQNRLGDVLTDSKSDHTPIDSNCRQDDYFPSWFSFLNNTN